MGESPPSMTGYRRGRKISLTYNLSWMNSHVTPILPVACVSIFISFQWCCYQLARAWMTDQNKQTEKNKIKACVSDAFFTPWTLRTSPNQKDWANQHHYRLPVIYKEKKSILNIFCPIAHWTNGPCIPRWEVSDWDTTNKISRSLATFYIPDAMRFHRYCGFLGVGSEDIACDDPV